MGGRCRMHGTSIHAEEEQCPICGRDLEQEQKRTFLLSYFSRKDELYGAVEWSIETLPSPQAIAQHLELVMPNRPPSGYYILEGI